MIDKRRNQNDTSIRQPRMSSKHIYTSSGSDEELLLTDQLARREKYAKRKGKRKDFRHGDDIRINKYVIYVLIGVIFTLLVLVIKNEIRSSSSDDSSSARKPRCKQLIYCTDPLTSGAKGKWIDEVNTTSLWQQESVHTIRRKLNLPENMTRVDMRCGLSAPIPKTRLAALCDPLSKDLHCCSETSGWCGNTRDHCSSRGGYDIRTKIPLQRATWKARDSSCQLYKFDQNKACNMLNKGVKKIVFLGDSQARHLFTTFLLYLSSNYKNGAIKKSKKANKYVMANCTHEYQLLNKNCRHYLVKSSSEVENFCSGEYVDFKVEYLTDYQTFLGKKSTKMIKDLQRDKNTYVVLGAGTHFNSDHNSYVSYYLRSMIQKQGKELWPKFIVETLPSVYSYKSNEKRWVFNQALENFLHSGISVFDNKLLSENLESHDGRTFGLKFNILKVNLLLHHLYNINPKCV